MVKGSNEMRAGRPAELRGGAYKVNLNMAIEDLDFLDEFCEGIRVVTAGSGLRKPIARARVVRAFLVALRESELDVSKVDSEEKLQDLLRRKLSARR